MSVEDLNDALRDETDESEAEGGKKKICHRTAVHPRGWHWVTFYHLLYRISCVWGGGGSSFFSLASAKYVY